jgi:pseudaminic acid synthase
MPEITIHTPKGKRVIGPGHPAFIVAEMSANHGQSFKQATALVKAAAKAGADAVKVQTYTPDTLTINSKKKWFYVGGKNNPKAWKDKTFYQLYQKGFMPWNWQPKLQKLAHRLGLVFFSTPFDDTAVDFLAKMKVPCYKIASYEATDITLLKKVAATGKPVIMSVGFATLPEVKYSVAMLKKSGAKQLALLHCTTSYAATGDVTSAHLATIMDLKKRFKVVSGFSDNSGGIALPVMATAVGASIIEKHLVITHNGKALDDRFSLDSKEFETMVKEIRTAEKHGHKLPKKALGKPAYGPQTPAEKYNRNFRRSLFVVADMKKGEKITLQNIRSIRPAYGLETKYFDKIVGKRAARNIERGTPLSWNLIA